MKRALSPLTNGVGYTALAGLLLAVAQAAWNAHNQGQPVTWQVIATARSLTPGTATASRSSRCR